MNNNHLQKPAAGLLVEDSTNDRRVAPPLLELPLPASIQANGTETHEKEEVVTEVASLTSMVEPSTTKNGTAVHEEETDWWVIDTPLEAPVPTHDHPGPPSIITATNGIKPKDSPWRVLIAQTDLEAALVLAKFFTQHGHQFWHATDGVEARTLLAHHKPDAVVLDLELADDNEIDLLHHLRQQFPQVKVFFTSADAALDEYAQEMGAHLLLHHPFSLADVEPAWLKAVESPAYTQAAEPAFEDDLPRVRLPMRLKITLPYVVLALLIALVGAYIVSRVVLESIEERFTSRLIEVGQLTADWMVQEESRLLETMRLLAYTQGLSDAVAGKDVNRLRELVLPIMVNYHEEAIEILDNQGRSLLSLHHRPSGKIEDYNFSQGDDIFAQWNFVKPVLEQQVDEHGDKFAGLAQAPWGNYFYVAGPILDEQGQQVGVLLLGRSLSTLVTQIQQDTLAHATIYDLQGQPLASTLSFIGDELNVFVSQESLAALEQQSGSSAIRELTVGSVGYTEILGAWQVRDDNKQGLIGASLSQTFLTHTNQLTRFQVFGLVTTAFLLVIAVGVYLANQITSPLLQMVYASAEVAQGNLDVKVEPMGNDEVAVLSHSFNHMVSRLREGALYRDLLGRTVSPEVREELRQTFASGTLHLEGQNALATVLITDIRDFTPLSEKVDPPTILNWLNEYFGELVPIITSYGGVVNGFQGDALLAFFGILPRTLTPQESAHRACLAAIDMLKAIETINLRRAGRGEPPLITGIGINTGIVIAGGLGTVDRLHYTILGDTVNTTQRLESLTRQFGESGAILSQHTLLALGEWQHSFQTEPLGAHTVKGKAEQVEVFRLWPVDKGTGVKESSYENAHQV